MKKLYYSLSILGVVLMSCGGSQETPAPVVAEKPSVDGQKIFKISCAVCHGLDGKLGLNGSKDLTISTLTLEERVALITNGKGVMPAQGAILKPEEIKAVAEYTMTLKKS